MPRATLLAVTGLLVAGVLLLSACAGAKPGAPAQTVPAGPQAKPAVQEYRVVFQMTENDPAKWGMLLTHVANLQEAMGGQPLMVEVVTYSFGVRMLQKSEERAKPLAKRLEEAARRGVTFIACERAMRGLNIDRSDLWPFVRTVDSGIAHVVRRQAEGWQYVRD